MRDRNNGVDRIAISVIIPIGKRIIDGIVGIPILSRRASKFNGYEAAAICLLDEHLQGRICLGGSGFPRVKFL